LGSVQLTPTTSNQNIQIGIQSYNCNLKFDWFCKCQYCFFEVWHMCLHLCFSCPISSRN
jgi:hypothetical protein